MVHELFQELLMIFFGHPEEISDHEKGVRPRVLADELAFAPRMEPVDLAISQPSERRLVLLQSSWV